MIKVFYKKALGPVSPDNPIEVDVEIPSGSSTSKIANVLDENGLINNKLVFKYSVRKKSLDGKLKAGNYVFSTDMKLEEILTSLSTGGKDGDTITVTIPEGFELKQIAYRLAELNLVDEDRFLELSEEVNRFSDKYDFLETIPESSSLEGYLFPDTYEININYSEEEIIDRMLSKFEEVYQAKLKDKIDETGLNFNEIVTLASIIEREGKVEKEMTLISAVFYNRMEKGMLLESCATVQYVLGERKEKLTYDDLKVESDYNTYIHQGLPPGPIASPGSLSLMAAVNPEDVDYLFFVAKGDGTHIFTNDFKDHIDAKNKE